MLPPPTPAELTTCEEAGEHGGRHRARALAPADECGSVEAVEDARPAWRDDLRQFLMAYTAALLAAFAFLG